jgi:phosphoribosylformylglycinamidine synthase
MNNTLYGGSPLSEFRLQKLLQQCRVIDPSVEGLIVRSVYWVDYVSLVEEAQQQRLQQLLSASQKISIPEGAHFWVVSPRFGTISPWSSKATEIAKLCNLPVQRLEQGWLFLLEGVDVTDAAVQEMANELADRMTETVSWDVNIAAELFAVHEPKPVSAVECQTLGLSALEQADQSLGLALSVDEKAYLLDGFGRLERDPTDMELMMFAQANSEHCRHKIFNADWVIDGQVEEGTLFSRIVSTSKTSPEGLLSLYKDNSAVMTGGMCNYLDVGDDYSYRETQQPMHILMKVETHNHPTAISPFYGAATGSGGEIRDEGATGRGSKPKAGLTGFSVSNLQIPDLPRPWEAAYGKPAHIDSSLKIMLEGPIGAASFNNEFGRPAICGYFRAFEQTQKMADGSAQVRGYHKPIMLAGGLGSIRETDIEKQIIPPDAVCVVLGGPAMLIGLGGGAASSKDSGSSEASLDFASVQRSNPEMERRCQEVIDRCCGQAENPIISIHDVGAGGLSNALPELVNDSHRGAIFKLREINNAEMGMSPMELWCNESQERYVLAIDAASVDHFSRICERERCPWAEIGEVTQDRHLLVKDAVFHNAPVDIPMSLLLGDPPKMVRDVSRVTVPHVPFDTTSLMSVESLTEAVHRVLQHPTVADKSFLITIGDRTITGLIAQDQMVGPWQTPVADCGVSLSDYRGFTGEAMSIGERSPTALLNAPASGRLAVAEAITNVLSADIRGLSEIRFSANWMAAAGHPGEDANLFDTVSAVSELCQELGVAIPVGKDSLSMKTLWRDESQNENKSVTSPLSLIISAFAPVIDCRRTLTPELHNDPDSVLLLIDLGECKNRLGGSILAETQQQLGDFPPDLDNPQRLKQLVSLVQCLRHLDCLQAYHDRSDGGLLVTLAEMSFASHLGLDIHLDELGDDPVAALFSEEPGIVVQVPATKLQVLSHWLSEYELEDCTHVLGSIRQDDQLLFRWQETTYLCGSRVEWQQLWSENSQKMQELRDHPACAQQQYELGQLTQPSMPIKLSFDPEESVCAPLINLTRPKVAILREQGVNGQREMAAAFDQAGFDCVDVHMSDLISSQLDLESFQGLVACGGFSYGDVLGAGRGWAQSILMNEQATTVFQNFFARDNSFSLGVCNGCQMLSQLQALIPGADHWPRFVRNQSEQFESRLALARIEKSPSVLLSGMEGSQLPVAVAHGEGQVDFSANSGLLAKAEPLTALRYINYQSEVTEHYPENPNGSVEGITGLTTVDGRVTIMMPHPERLFRSVQYSWAPSSWQETGPWMRLFQNARLFVK